MMTITIEALLPYFYFFLVGKTHNVIEVKGIYCSINFLCIVKMYFLDKEKCIRMY